MTTATACHDCAGDTEHCHDTLIVHVDQTIECSAGDCVKTTIAHLHYIPCTDLTPPCRCGDGAA